MGDLQKSVENYVQAVKFEPLEPQFRLDLGQERSDILVLVVLSLCLFFCLCFTLSALLIGPPPSSHCSCLLSAAGFTRARTVCRRAGCIQKDDQ
eukprot:758187-Hanusia_phi.AAC.3